MDGLHLVFFGVNMKKQWASIFIIFLLSGFLYSEEVGKLLERTETSEKVIEVRAFEIKNFKAGDFLSGKDTVYEDYISKKEIGKLNWHTEKIDISKICIVHYLSKKNKDGHDTGEFWLEVSSKSVKGWICYYSNIYRNFFENDSYRLLETIETGSKKWTVRKLDQWVSVWTNLNVRDKPGLTGNKVHLIKYGENGFQSFRVVAITEETETIDGKKDCWVKIEYKKDKYGWVFGGYVDVERGGPKYLTPVNEILFLLGNQP